MAMPFAHEDLTKLKNFIDFVSVNQTVLNLPQLAFVKDFIEKFGGKVPAGTFTVPEGSKCPFSGKAANQPDTKEAKPDIQEEPEDVVVESESEESEVELDTSGVISGDTDPEQFMGDSEKETTEEDIDQADDFRSQAVAAYSQQKFQEAIDLYTRAIEHNPGNALIHAKRGQAFLKLQKPNACIRDCDKALELNCDSATAYKFRGRANRLLGNWEAAAKDLRQACKLDFDEETDEWLREVTPNAKKIEQHRIKLQRKREERNRKNLEANIKAREKRKQQSAAAGGGSAGAGGFPGGFPFGGFGGADAGAGQFNINDLLSGMNDPEVAAALEDIAKNPNNIEKYKSNPKIGKLLELIKNMSGKVPGAGGGGFPGFPGGFPGGAGATPDAETPPPEEQAPPHAQPKMPSFADDGLD